VNAVIKAHVEKKPEITFSELKRDFPNPTQRSFGDFDLTTKAEDIFQRWGHKRHHIKKEEVI
jgi:hypothetical protein